MTYNRGTPFARQALDEVTLDIAAGAVTAVVGATAAGKSSLLQVMAGVMRPTEGSVIGPDGGRIRGGERRDGTSAPGGAALLCHRLGRCGRRSSPSGADR